MEILVTIVLVLVGLVVLVWLAGFIIPDHVRIERAVDIDAPRETVFALISDFQEWSKWSPWADRDPQARYEYEGAGIGHTMRWTSEVREVGNGSQEIIGLETPGYMKSRLDFGAMGSADAIFTLTEQAGGTHVVWAFDAHMRRGVPLMMKPVAAYMGFMMEKWLAPDYEKGLARLKTAAEAATGSAAAAPAIEAPGNDTGTAKMQD